MAVLPVSLANLKCPICEEIPPKEIFQCQKGHVICSVCYVNKTIHNCPKCKTAYGSIPIRNLIVEGLLDNLKLDCANKFEGCKETLLRQDVSNHRKTCNYRPIKLCHLLGYADCDFASSQGNVFAKHLMDAHRTSRRKTIEWSTFIQKFDTKQPWKWRCFFDADMAEVRTWTHVDFIIYVSLNYSKAGIGYLSCGIIHLGKKTTEASQYIVKLSLRNAIDNPWDSKTLISKWSGVPGSYKDSEEFVQAPPFVTPFHYLTQNALKPGQKDFDLALDISIKPKIDFNVTKIKNMY